MHNDLLTPEYVMQSLQVSKNRFYQMVASGEVPSIKLGRLIRIPRKSWEAWLTEQDRLALSGMKESCDVNAVTA